MQGQITGMCSDQPVYTGVEGCNTFDKQPIGVIFTDKDVYFNSSDNISARLKTLALKLKSPTVLPLMDGLVNVEPSGGGVRVAQEGFGSPTVNGNDPFQETLTFSKGGLCLYKQLTALKGQDKKVFFVDEDLRAFGTMSSDGKIYGFEANIGIEYRKNVGATTSAIKVTLLYSNNYFNEFKNVHAIPLTNDIRGTRAIGLNLKSYSVMFGVISVEIVTACSGVNVGSSIAETASAEDFEAYNFVVGAWQTADMYTYNVVAQTYDLIFQLPQGNTIAVFDKLRIRSTSDTIISKLNSLYLGNPEEIKTVSITA